MPKLTNINVPKAFLCALSGRLMTDPVKAADGYIYERARIEPWIMDTGLSPVTYEPLADFHLSEEFSLRIHIQVFMCTHQICSYTQFMQAIKDGDMQKLNQLNFLDLHLNATIAQGWTPLLIAAYYGHRDLVSYLLAQWVKIDACTVHGWNAIQLAAHKGHKEIVALLANSCIGLIFTTVNGMSVNEIAAQAGHHDIELLLNQILDDEMSKLLLPPEPIKKSLSPKITSPTDSTSKWKAIAEQSLPEVSMMSSMVENLMANGIYKITITNPSSQRTGINLKNIDNNINTSSPLYYRHSPIFNTTK